MKHCIYWFYMGFCALLNDCKCNKKQKQNETFRKFSVK